MNRKRVIKLKASYFWDEPERIVQATELVKNRLYRYDSTLLCDGEGNRIYPTPVSGEMVKVP